MNGDGGPLSDAGLQVGTCKADFTDIYAREDPRSYYAALWPLGYQIPQRALPVIEGVLAAARPEKVLDVCCSYGINAALLRHDVSFDELAGHYAGLAGVSPGAVARADREFLTARRRRQEPRVVGLDSSGPAIDYAVRVGLLDDGYAEDLESDAPSPGLAAAVADLDLLVCTGGVGYIGARTFDRLLGAVANPERLWLAVFVLRVFPYDEVIEVLESYGLVTEKLPGTFRQRRFADEDERTAANHDVLRLGVDPTGKEADGWYHANCYLTRPAADAAEVPAAALLASALR